MAYLAAKDVRNIEYRFYELLYDAPGTKEDKQAFFQRRLKILVPKTNYEVMWERLVDHLGPGGAAEAVFDYVLAIADERLKRLLVNASGRARVRLLENEQAVVRVIFWEKGSLRRIGQLLVGYLWDSGKLSELTGRKVVMGADAPSAQPEHAFQPTLPVRQFPYDVALSYASEQRRYVRRVYKKLLQLGVQTFYDEGEEVNLWGKNLEPHLQKVFYKMARVCVVFVSKYYVNKPWPMFEAESALARAVQERGEYVLPVRFDNSELPGLLPTIKYVWARDYTPEKLAEILRLKLKDLV